MRRQLQGRLPSLLAYFFSLALVESGECTAFSVHHGEVGEVHVVIRPPQPRHEIDE